MTIAASLLAIIHYNLDGAEIEEAGRNLFIARKSAAENNWTAADLEWLAALDSIYHAGLGSVSQLGRY